ncbi:MAG: CRISPR-associated helicase Cas3' [Magnetococcales bacterium]|nr:CRISPR-associated helicase Cas3' [Magnetococcales bacterium]
MQTTAKPCWGKRTENLGCIQTHPLNHHCLEVAAVLATLLESATIRKRLARAGGRADLSPLHCLRLAALAALHDAGKCNHGFQEQGKGWNSHGHVREIFQLLYAHPRGPKGFDALDLATLRTWFQEGDQLEYGLWAIFCHHGRLLRGDPTYETRPANDELRRIDARVWNQTPDRDPLDGLIALSQAMRVTFPEAFVASDDPAARLPLTPALAHLYSGLITLADWIASDAERFFPFAESDAPLPTWMELLQKARRAVRELGCAVTAARTGLNARPMDFAHLFALPAPNPMQAEVIRRSSAATGEVVILESETGSGKTEAALMHFFKLFQAGRVDGLYFALPTRAAAVQIHRRVVEAMQRACGPDHPPVVLAVPGYLRVDAVEGEKLAPFQTLWPDDRRDRYRYRGWAAEHPKRFLAAPVAVGTVDQVLLSALAVPHAQLRAASLSRLLLVVDEVHASDAYMITILEEVVRRHREVGGETLLMSATLGVSARSLFLNGPRAALPAPDKAAAIPYPLLSSRNGQPDFLALSDGGASKAVTIVHAPLADAPDAVAQMALEAAQQGARVLVIRNTVNWAIATQEAMERCAGSDSPLLLRCGDVATPHHGRYAPEDRKQLDLAIESCFGKQAVDQGGVVAVSTQTTEQSLDIDADWLITDLCPMDVLLQRIGRLHRHRRLHRPACCALARVLLLIPEEGVESLLDANGRPSSQAMGHGWGSVYPDLRILAATLEALPDQSQITIPADNRRLVEAATHPDLLTRVAEARGAAWSVHGNDVWGRGAAQKNKARQSIYKRDQWLHACQFHELQDERIATRLGLDDRRVIFAAPHPVGPFGTPVPELTLSMRHFRHDSPPDDARPEALTVEERGFFFTFHGLRFRYHRMGLRLITTE